MLIQVIFLVASINKIGVVLGNNTSYLLFWSNSALPVLASKNI